MGWIISESGAHNPRDDATMASSYLPIDPEHRDDPFYRYQMARLDCKVEGRGNGIKTALMNLAEVGRDIETPPDILMRHLKYELGAQGKLASGRYVLTGRHSAEDLTEHLYSYISEVKLCSECRSPETILGGKKRLKRKCRACGAIEVVPTRLRVTDVLLKNAARAMK